MTKLFNSFTNACAGLNFAFVRERNLKIHFGALIITCIAALYFNLNKTEWIALIFCFALVIALELINTAIEQLCNYVQPNHHLTIKKIKDISAAAVLICSIAAFIIGLIIFIPKIYSHAQTIF